MRLFFLTLALADTAAAQPAGFRAVPAEAVQWQPIPNGQGAQSALIAGNPSQPGTYVIRVKFPPHVMDRPHHHSRDRHVTVLQGRWVALDEAILSVQNSDIQNPAAVVAILALAHRLK